MTGPPDAERGPGLGHRDLEQPPPGQRTTTSRIQDTAGDRFPVDGPAGDLVNWLLDHTAPNGSRPTKRRRTRDEMALVRAHLYSILAGIESAMTVRQVFYQAVSRGVIAKTEGEYKSTVCRLLTDMRLDGVIPFGWIADNTRWMRKPRTYSSMESALETTASTYRRQLWDNQGAYVEVWLEKEALAGVVVDITSEFDVPLMVTRGYPSVSFVHEAAEVMHSASGARRPDTAEISDVLTGLRSDDRDVRSRARARQDAWHGDKAVHVYYFGDHDPSGVDISRHVEERLYEFAADEYIVDFKRVAVTERQIEDFNLPTRPTKRSDTRAKGWHGGSVELDAIPPDDLRDLVRGCIEQHVDHDQLELLQTVEAEERQVLQRLTSREFIDLALTAVGHDGHPVRQGARGRSPRPGTLPVLRGAVRAAGSRGGWHRLGTHRHLPREGIEVAEADRVCARPTPRRRVVYRPSAAGAGGIGPGASTSPTCAFRAHP
jgi:hypothetical protein